MFVHRLKLRPPQLLANWIERPEVERRFHPGVGVFSIVAGPGYGKTVLAAMLYERWEGAKLWYSLDATDGDLAVFAAHLEELIRSQGLSFGFAGEAWRLGTPKEIGSRFAEVCADLPAAPLLVFDDVHALDGSRALSALDELIARAARAGATFIVTGRAMPLTLHAIAASARLTSVGAGDLSFGSESSLEYLERAGLRAEREALARLARRAEGWPAGLALLASTAEFAPGNGVPAVLGARDDETRRLLFEYLATEVLDSLAPAERAFLLETSILESLEVERCNALLERADSAEMLASLARRGLFVTRRADDAYQCHQLFREFLRHTLVRSYDAEAIARLHRRAAVSLAAAGDRAGEIAHLLDAGDLSGAALALERSALVLVSNGLTSRVHAFLQRLGADEIERSPTLLVALGRVQHQRADWDRALSSFERAIALARELEQHDILAEAVRLSAPILASRGEFERLQGLLESTLALRDRLKETSVTALEIAYGAWLLEIERFDEALELFRSIMPAVVTRGDFSLQGMVLHNTAVAQMRRGEPYGALAVYERALKIKREAGQRISALLTLANMVFAYRVLGDFDEAERLCRLLIDDARDIGNASVLAHGLENEGGIALARGDVAGASKSFRAAQQASDPGDVFVLPEVLLGLARCALLLGNAAEADDLAAKAVTILRSAGRRQEVAPALLVRAQCALLRSDMQNVLAQTREAQEAAAQGADAVLQATVELDASVLFVRVFGRTGLASIDQEAMTAATGGIALLHQRDYRFLLHTKSTTFAELHEHMRRWGIGVALIPEKSKGGAALRVEMLGGLRIFLDGEPIPPEMWKRRKAREIFAYLVSSRERAAPRSRLIDMYWPETDADAAHDNLRVTVSAIRKAIGDVVKFEANGYRFVPPPGTLVDVEVFDEHIDAARQALPRGDAAEARRRYAAATELYRGDFLDGIEEGGWQWRERERLRAACLEALRHLAKDGEAEESTRRFALDRILEIAPFDLEAVRLRLRALIGEMRVSEARREYDEWRQRYRATIGAEAPDVWPSAETVAPAVRPVLQLSRSRP